MVPARVVTVAFVALLQENVSLLTIEVASGLCAFLLLLHVHSSGKRSATMLAAAALLAAIVELVFFGYKRWHAQALVRVLWRVVHAEA